MSVLAENSARVGGGGGSVVSKEGFIHIYKLESHG